MTSGVWQGARYLLVGVLGTAVNAGLYLGLRMWWATLPATLVALVLSTMLSSEVNRRFTFGAAHPDPWRLHLQSAGTVAFYAGYSTVVLATLDAFVTDPTAVQETIALTAASALGGLARFLILRHWVFTRPASASSKNARLSVGSPASHPAAAA